MVPPPIMDITFATKDGSGGDNNLDKLLDSLSLAAGNTADPTAFEKQSGLASIDEKDELTADAETWLESPGFSSSCSDAQSVVYHDEEEDIDDAIYANDCSDDERSNQSTDDCSDDERSTQSHQTNDSTRLLLKQAKQRLHHQTVYEEVKVLREEVSQYKNSLESTQRQNLDLKNRCNALESQLANAHESIHSNKIKELRYNEEMAEREKDHMNQLNEVYMEILKRDEKIIELQNLWNEEQTKRKDATREKESSDNVVGVETKVDEEFDLDESSCSDGEFI